MMRRHFVLLALLLGGCMQRVSAPSNPFDYDLGIRTVQSKDGIPGVTICCHGYGDSNAMVDEVSSYGAFSDLVGFNFPDHRITEETDHHLSKYGSIDEITPLLFLIKFYACSQKEPRINLYGKSAGGGAIINALAVLNNYSYAEKLRGIGISSEDARSMLCALQDGLIVLNCPLKSVDEILAHRGYSKNLAILADRYNQNKMNPIETVQCLSGLTLNIVLHFQDPDEILGNRDDALFIERLKKANEGTTNVIIGSGAGHNGYHIQLRDYLKRLDSRSH